MRGKNELILIFIKNSVTKFRLTFYVLWIGFFLFFFCFLFFNGDWGRSSSLELYTWKKKIYDEFISGKYENKVRKQTKKSEETKQLKYTSYTHK